MTKYILVEAIGNINDRHISESASFHRKTMSKAWIILSAASAACIALIFVALPVVRFFTVNNSSDPYWSETHLQVSSSEEAIRKFGDDLLIDKMVLDNISDDPYEAYTLTFSNRDSELRSNWERLLCEIYYGRVYTDMENPYIVCNIAFSDSDKQMVKYDFEKYNYVVSSEILNGVQVKYGEHNEVVNGINYYGARAIFTYNDIQYYISSKDLQLVIDTVRQMLS